MQNYSRPFTPSNTDGYTVDQLDCLNEAFERLANSAVSHLGLGDAREWSDDYGDEYKATSENLLAAFDTALNAPGGDYDPMYDCDC